MLGVHEKAKGLIFDIDGTLVDSMPTHYLAWKETMKAHGIDYPESMFYELAGFPTDRIVPVINERFGLSLDPEETAEKKENLYWEMMDRITVIEPVAGIARRNHGRLPMTLGTGSTRRLAERTVQITRLEKLFLGIVTPADVVKHKPAPDTFLKCAQIMGIPPEQCQVFEDGEAGLKAAKDAGMVATDIRPYIG